MAFRPENIPLVARRFWTSDELPSFFSNTLACPLSGGHCQVYKLGFSDQTTWAVRIPIHARNAPKEVIITQLQCEIENLKRLNANGFDWAPKLIGYDLTYDNEVGFPLIVLSWIPGDPLEWNDTVPLHRCDRDKVLQQIIKLVLQLIQCTKVKSKHTSMNYDINYLQEKAYLLLTSLQMRWTEKSFVFIGISCRKFHWRTA